MFERMAGEMKVVIDGDPRMRRVDYEMKVAKAVALAVGVPVCVLAFFYFAGRI